MPNGTLADDLAAYFSSFQQIISYLFDPDGIFEANLRRAGAKNVLAAYTKLDDSEHASRQLARPLQQLALYLEEHGAKFFPRKQDRGRRKKAPRFCRRGNPCIAVHPGSGSPRKNWPLDHWRRLLSQMLAESARPGIVIVGGEADRAQLSELRGQMPGKTAVLLEDLPLSRLAAVLERCALSGAR